MIIAAWVLLVAVCVAILGLTKDGKQTTVTVLLTAAAVLASIILSGCGGNTTEPHPPTCWPVVVIDSVEYCGGEG